MSNPIVRLRKLASQLTSSTSDDEPDAATIRNQVVDLMNRLRISENALSERSERLYELQKHYSSEHFALQECMRDLKTERMRNAGAYASMATTLERAKALQTRIVELKERLRKYEPVEDLLFDSEPILREGNS